jgi:hypothetical protein
MRRLAAILPGAVAVSLAAALASANTSHDGWPKIDGVLLMNKTDGSRPLDARPGHDPFAGRDRRYSCDASTSAARATGGSCADGASEAA